jgi:transcriptional regulator with XRE-family HTH domain
MQKENTVGKLLRELRARLGLSQEGLAAALGVSFPTVSRWERGKSKPRGPASTILYAYIKNIGNVHPDLFARFQTEAPIQLRSQAVRVHTFPSWSALTKEPRVIVFQFGEYEGTPDENLSAELLMYVEGIAQVIQNLFRKAQSGDITSREALRLILETAKMHDRYSRPQAFQRAPIRVGPPRKRRGAVAR